MSDRAVQKDNNALGLKAKILMLVGIPVLVIVVCSVVIYYSAQSLVSNEIYAGDETEEYVLPATDEEAAAFVSSLIENAAASSEVRVSRGTSVGINDLEGTVTDAQKNLIEMIKGSVVGGIEGIYGSETLDYGEKNTLLADVRLSADNTVMTCEDSEGIAEFTFTEENPSAEKMQPFVSDAQKTDEIFEPFSGVFEVKENSLLPYKYTFTAKADMKSECIREIHIKRDYSVHLRVVFTGDYAELGEKEFTFIYSVQDNYSVSFAGIKITKDEIRLTKNGYDTVSLEANVSENVSNDEFSLTYEISDENIATVDENGMVEAVNESVEPAVLTVTLNYLGKTYTDTCPVYVRKQVDSVTMKPHTAKLAVGETTALSIRFDPKDATVRDLKWFSEDESIAAVDENGVVTAVAPGTVKIVAVALDGNLMTACSVTVNG